MTALRRPLGAVLAGGGALAAWQAGVLDALAAAGVVFDRIVGFSAGAVSGAAWACGRVEGLVEFYRSGGRGLCRLRPGLWPLRVCSNGALRESLAAFEDDAAARASLRCELTVMSLRIKDRTTVYSRFTPPGGGPWDGPLVPRLLASCAIPFVFPPVEVAENGSCAWHLDGGVPGRELMRLDALEGCADVLVIEMVRPGEPAIRTVNPALLFKLGGRAICRLQTDHAVARALARPGAPRVLRLCPSRFLDFSMLGFSARHCAPAMELGREDAVRFLGAPERYEQRTTEKGSS